MAIITTLLGDRDDSELQKREGVVDDENARVEWVEYCPLGCDGPAHQSGQPDAVEFFCSKHIHRSAGIRLKKGLGAVAEMQGFQ